MDTPLNRWASRTADLLAELGRRPAVLFALLLALNAVAFPYMGLIHDARLYSFQVLNRVEGGAFGGDLFFRFGSQDQYSLFSRATSPLVALLGLPWAFFLLYLVCNALMILGMQMLTAALLRKPGLTALALIFLVSDPLLFGGWRIFQVNEQFLTSRNIAVALTLLGLAAVLRGRPLVALLLLVGGCLMHPLMAIGGVAVLALWVAAEHLPRRAFAVLAALAGVAGTVVLLTPPLAGRIFGQMDDEWLMHVRYATAYNFPDEWSFADWMQMVVPALVVGAAAWHARGDRLLCRTGWTVLLVAVGGVIATTVAGLLGYRLLFQAQPYRAVWLLKVLYVPMGFWLAVRLWREHREAARLRAVGVLGLMSLTSFIPEEFVLPLACLPLFAVYFRGVEAKPRLDAWRSLALAYSLLVGLFGWGLYKFGLIAAFSGPLARFNGGTFAWGQMLSCLGPVFWTLSTLWFLARLRGLDGFGRRTAGVAVATGLAAQFGVFLVTFTPYYQEHYSRYFDDTQFVSHVLARRTDAAPRVRPTVYWCTGQVDVVWLGLRAHSYFDFLQIQGILFSRDTAAEGSRRARLVRQFEMERIREEKVLLSERWCDLMANYYGVSLDEAAPSRADLERLCREPELDFVVSRHNFDGLYAETNGRVYVYDCNQLRRRLIP